MPMQYGQYGQSRNQYPGRMGGGVSPRQPSVPYPGAGQTGPGYGSQSGFGQFRGGGQITSPYGGMGQVPQPFPRQPFPGMGGGQQNPYGGGGVPQPFPGTPFPGMGGGGGQPSPYMDPNRGGGVPQPLPPQPFSGMGQGDPYNRTGGVAGGVFGPNGQLQGGPGQSFPGLNNPGGVTGWQPPPPQMGQINPQQQMMDDQRRRQLQQLQQQMAQQGQMMGGGGAPAPMQAQPRPSFAPQMQQMAQPFQRMNPWQSNVPQNFNQKAAYNPFVEPWNQQP